MGYVVGPDVRPRPGVRVSLLTPNGQPVLKRTLGGPPEIDPIETSTDERGFFQITGLEDGSYKLEARDRSLATAAADADVYERSETRLEALTLAVPVPVEVDVDPPTHPSGKKWSIAFHRTDRQSTESEDRRQVSELGSLRASLPPGSYLLVLEYGEERWVTQEAEVEAPVTRVALQVRAMALRGLVRLGSRPLAATLAFGGKRGATSLVFQSDEEGVFGGYLPNPGSWPVQVEAVSPLVRRFFKGIEVRADEPGGYRADIELPATRLRGYVALEDGRRAIGAILSFKPSGTDDRLVQAKADTDGGFDVWGLPTGQVLVSAVGPDQMASDALYTSISEDERGSELRLVLRKRQKFSARILGRESGSAVVGAAVKVTPVGPSPTMASSIARTDSEGRFEVLLPPGSLAADVTYGTSDRSFGMARLHLTGGRSEQALSSEPVGGTLVVLRDRERDRDKHVLLTNGEATEYLAYLQGAAPTPEEQRGEKAPEAGAVSVGPMAPGSYRACLVLPADTQTLGTECASGVLLPGGELVLRLGGHPSASE